jgi:prefoldin subunit 5
MPDYEAQVEQLSAVIEGKDAQITSLTEQVQGLGAFKAEAMNGRETIANLSAAKQELETALAAASKQAAENASAAKSAAASSGASQKKLDAAQKIAEGLKVLLG